MLLHMKGAWMAGKVPDYVETGLPFMYSHLDTRASQASSGRPQED